MRSLKERKKYKYVKDFCIKKFFKIINDDLKVDERRTPTDIRTRLSIYLRVCTYSTYVDIVRPIHLFIGFLTSKNEAEGLTLLILSS